MKWILPDPEQESAQHRKKLLERLTRTLTMSGAETLQLLKLNLSYLQSGVDTRFERAKWQDVSESVRDAFDASLWLERQRRTLIALLECLNAPETPLCREVELLALAEQLCADAETIHESTGIVVRLEAEPGGWLTAAEPRYLRHICANLLSNALRACSAGDTVTLSLARGKTETVFAVTDTGCGLAAAQTEQKDRFFDGMQTSLEISAEYCRRMGWTLILEDRPEGGCRAELHLPHRDAAETPAAAVHSPMQTALEGENTLLFIREELQTVPALRGVRLEDH